jgi:hypothetical protein
MCADSKTTTPSRRGERREPSGSDDVRFLRETTSARRAFGARIVGPLGVIAATVVALGAASCAEDTVPDATTAGGAGGSAGSGGTGTGGATGGSAGSTTGSGGASDSGAGAGGSSGSGVTGGSGGEGGSGGTATGGSGGGTGGGTGGATGGTGGATGGTGGTGTGGAAGSTGGTAGANPDGGGTGGAGGSGGADAGVPTPRDPECNLNGRWLLAQRNLLSLPLAQCQAIHTWYYYEIRHELDTITVTKGLHCGYEAVKKSSQSANVSNPAMWPAMLANMTSTGRTGTFNKQATNCHLTLPIEYVIRGATVSYYRNPGNALPAMGSAAAGPGGNPPGWEDWDNDSNPGFTLDVNSPLAKGTLYLSTRDTNTIDATTPLSMTLFKAPMTFTTAQSVLGTTNATLALGGTPWDNVASHFTYFQKLQDGQAVGTDTQICEQVRTLKDALPGDANDLPVSATCQ